jgi:hypothetical protein
MYIPDIQTLINQPSVASDPEFIVAGYYSPGDGGGGTFVWIVDISPPADDGGIILHPSLSSGLSGGYYKRIYSGTINVRWFGAIMFASTGGGTINNVTPYFNAARDSAFTKDGTIYFPEDKRYDTGTSSYYIQPYVGAFNLLNYNINLLGDGVGSVLKADGLSNPVLILGNNPGGMLNTIAHLTINGLSGSTKQDGAVYTDPAVPEYGGRWIFLNVFFQSCSRAIYKPYGNIGNSYENCSWDSNDFGYYAVGVSNMHSGSDRFLGGHMGGSANVGIYLTCAIDFGQLIIDGITIENNPGFGILIRLSSVAKITGNAIDLRNVWMENNATTSTSITIGPTTYPASDVRGLRFEGVRSVALTNMSVNSIALIDSSVNLYNCRSDRAAGSNVVDVDAASSLISYEHRNNYQVSENIFVNSLSYDGTGDIGQNPSVPTSVWGPLRVVTQTGTSDIRISERFDQNSAYRFYDVSTLGYVYTSPISGGILRAMSAQLSIPAGTVLRYITFIPIYSNEIAYFVWSIHTYLCRLDDSGFGDATGVIATADSALVLGQVIFKPNQWACSYGIKKWVGDPTDPHPGTLPVALYFFGNALGGKFKIADLQVVKFDNLYDAESFVNSRAFADTEATCEPGDGG